MSLIVRFLMLCLLSLTISAHVNAGIKQHVQNVRVWHSPENTRIVFDVSANIKHTVFTLQNPRRLVVDIADATLVNALPKLAKANPHLSTIRTSDAKANPLRFVFELKSRLKVNSFLLTPNELYGHRLVIDLEEVVPQGLPLTKIQKEKRAIESQTSSSDKSLNVVATAQTTTKPFVVAIDAGHGGEDPGAIGYYGSREKKITLSIAKKLKKVIDADSNMQSYLIRKGDYFIPLKRRRQLAKQVNADIFISIHADAFRQKSVRGFSVFALSQRGATSAMARALAAKENAADSVGGVSLKDKDDVLAKVLVDLSMTNTVSESVNFGGRVLKALKKHGKLHSRRVEQAGFEVLKSADIPSILIETGFITNPTEEKNLRSGAYQQKIADSVYAAISQYYQQTPHYTKTNYASPHLPRASVRPSALRATKPRYHRVVRGDSLSTIAQKYRVSLSQLKRANKLRSNTAVLGRRLQIPSVVGSTKRVSSRKKRKSIRYTVRRGDSLSKLSAKFNVKMSTIKLTNKLKSNTLRLGQKLIIPQTNKPVTQVLIHKVKRGDTLSEIAKNYNSSIKKIMNANKLRTKTVMLGQRLKIPN